MEDYLRDVNKNDCDLLFNWANDELVRKNSFNTEKIKYEKHVEWFKIKLSSHDSYMYILCNKKQDVGIIRVELEGKKGIISYSLNKKYRGLGLSLKMLFLLEHKIIEQNVEIDELIGFVKKSNLASQKVFEKLNYIKNIENDYIKYTKIFK